MSAQEIAHLSGMIERVERGEETIVNRADTPVEETIPLVDRTAIGSLAGMIDLSDGWDSPESNAEIAAAFDPS